jgi:hypothetical protein
VPLSALGIPGQRNCSKGREYRGRTGEYYSLTTTGSAMARALQLASMISRRAGYFRAFPSSSAILYRGPP